MMFVLRKFSKLSLTSIRMTLSRAYWYIWPICHKFGCFSIRQLYGVILISFYEFSVHFFAVWCSKWDPRFLVGNLRQWSLERSAWCCRSCLSSCNFPYPFLTSYSIISFCCYCLATIRRWIACVCVVFCFSNYILTLS